MSAQPEVVFAEPVVVPVRELVEAEWNANRVPAATMAKLRRSIERFGFVEHLVVRPLGGRQRRFEVLSGNHRLRLLREMGALEVPCRVVEVGDADARVLAQALNRTRGEDDPEAYARLLEEVLAEYEPSQVAEVLPVSVAALERVLLEMRAERDPDAVPEVPAEPVSRLGEVYELGRHRLMCGDATDRGAVAALLAGAEPLLCVTDPPYGVDYDPAWRQRAAEEGKLAYAARRVGPVANDEQVDWSAAWALAPCDVLYVWHAGRHASAVQRSIEESGFEMRSQIIWAKPHFPISRGHYHWRHEPCWYAVRRGASAHWIGDRRQTTVWDVTLDANVAGGHSTQKPVEIMARPLWNHEGDVYDPFVGSGSTLIAAEMVGRTCFAMEIDPAYCDVVRARFEAFVG